MPRTIVQLWCPRAQYTSSTRTHDGMQAWRKLGIKFPDYITIKLNLQQEEEQQEEEEEEEGGRRRRRRRKSGVII